MNSLVSTGKEPYRLGSPEVDAEMELVSKMFIKDQHLWKEDWKKEWTEGGVDVWCRLNKVLANQAGSFRVNITHLSWPPLGQKARPLYPPCISHRTENDPLGQGGSLQKQQTVKEWTAAGFLLTALPAAGQQVFPWRRSELVHFCVSQAAVANKMEHTVLKRNGVGKGMVPPPPCTCSFITPKHSQSSYTGPRTLAGPAWKQNQDSHCPCPQTPSIQWGQADMHTEGLWDRGGTPHLASILLISPPKCLLDRYACHVTN